jgi:hypothetical protein
VETATIITRSGRGMIENGRILAREFDDFKAVIPARLRLLATAG